MERIGSGLCGVKCGAVTGSSAEDAVAEPGVVDTVDATSVDRVGDLEAVLCVSTSSLQCHGAVAEGNYILHFGRYLDLSAEGRSSTT